MRRFRLNRLVDVSGVSGTGVVALGVLLSDGKVVLHWQQSDGAIGTYPSMEAVERIHGHEGATVVEWIDA